jgi:hypothetical protein
MKTNQKLKKFRFFLLFFAFSFLISGCDYFFEDPRLILYRPATIRVEDSSGQLLSQFPIPLNSSNELKAQSSKLKELMDIDLLWGKEPVQTGLTDLFNNQEIPYLGGDNCLNSLFFDLIGIPYAKESNLAYHSKDFYGNLQGYVKEPANYFFFNDRLFLKESTYPYINKDQFTLIGEKKMKTGADQALDQFYQERLKEYRKMFNERVKTFKVSCEYPPQTMGRVKEDIVLSMMETEDSILFLADKHIHMVMRKDNSLRYVSDFSFSKAFFREQLHFKPN